jgi:transposase
MERAVTRKAKAMTRNEVIVRAIAGKLTWIQAAQICGITDRQMRRLKVRYQKYGYDGLVDHRGGRPRRRRISVETIERICTLKQEKYAEFSVQHFWEQLTQKHGEKISYTWTRLALQAAGLVEKSAGRGKYRRRRERRPLVGMMLHMDGSTHAWIEGQAMQDLVVVQDDADSRILSAFFVPEEGTESTFRGLAEVLREQGRFCEFYTDRGSHFCHNQQGGQGPSVDHQGQVSRALKVLGIRQILARSPEARGRSERTFRTIQGRLPNELRAEGITDYDAANEYLRERFVPDFNRRFTVRPAQPGSAFVKLVGIDLELLLSVHHGRIVNKDNTVSFEGRTLQLPPGDRGQYARCPVTVHQLTQGRMAISYQGQEIARYDGEGRLLATRRGGQRAARCAGAPVAQGAPSAPSQRAKNAQRMRKAI